MVVLTRVASDAPAAVRTASRLRSASSVCSSIPSGATPVAGWRLNRRSLPHDQGADHLARVDVAEVAERPAVGEREGVVERQRAGGWPDHPGGRHRVGSGDGRGADRPGIEVDLEEAQVAAARWILASA